MGALSSPTVRRAETAAALAVVGELSALSGTRPPFGESGGFSLASWAWGRVPLSALTWGCVPVCLIAAALSPTPGMGSRAGGLS